MNEDGFPHQGFPSGWYQIAWAGELEAGAVRPLRYFSRDLVLYRGSDGEHHLLDAFCPHMGAHLGYGGCVEGDDIVCPYHGWTWAPDGHNVVVPSEGKATDRRRIGTWTTSVANGIVWTWFDASGAAPWWPAPVTRALRPRSACSDFIATASLRRGLGGLVEPCRPAPDGDHRLGFLAGQGGIGEIAHVLPCLLYTSDAADEL